MNSTRSTQHATVAIVLLFFSFFIFSCSNNDDNDNHEEPIVLEEAIVGEWKLRDRFTMDGENVGIEYCELQTTLQFIEGSSLNATFAEGDEPGECESNSLEGTWQVEEDSLNLYFDLTETEFDFQAEVTENNNKLTLSSTIYNVVEIYRRD